MQNLIQETIILMETEQFEKAIKSCNKIIKAGYSHPKISMFLAISFSKVNNLEKSQKLFKQLILQFPNNSELHYNYALILQQNNFDQLALEHYETCIQCNPGHASAYNNIGSIRLNLKQADGAKHYFENAIKIQPNNNEYLQNLAFTFFQLKQFIKCSNILNRIISIDLAKEDTFTLAIDAMQKTGDLLGATKCYKIALRKYPNSAEVLNLGGLVETDNKKYNRAIKLLTKALKIDSFNLDYNINHLTAQSFIEPNSKNTIKKLQNIVERNNDSIKVYEFAAKLAENTSNFKTAKHFIKKGINLDKNNASLMLIKGKIYTRKNKLKKSIKWLIKASKNTHDLLLKSEIIYALAQSYDKNNQYELAWNNIQIANQLSQASSGDISYDEQYIKETNSLLNDFTSNYDITPSTQQNLREGGVNLAFIVGFPRSGTTLIERILLAHPKVKIMEETNAINELFLDINKLPGKSFFKKLHSLSSNQKKKFAMQYIDNIHEFTNFNENDTIIDKMPMNGKHLILIHHIFPDAKIILSIRHPLDTCLSCLMQDKLQLYSFESVAKVYNSYMTLLASYINTIQLNLFELKYENLILNMPKTTKNVLKFLDLKWDDNLLNFHKTKLLINTPSYHQVSQPIYTTAQCRYKNYINNIQYNNDLIDKWLSFFKYKK